MSKKQAALPPVTGHIITHNHWDRDWVLTERITQKQAVGFFTNLFKMMGREPDYRMVLVSGTASIAPEGETVHLDDTNAQIDLTLRVVNEILRSRGLGFADTTRANAYFKHQADASSFGGFCDDFGIPRARVVISHDDVCRDDLLFEIELDAIAAA